MTVIDIHTHCVPAGYLPPDWPTNANRASKVTDPRPWPTLRVDSATEATIMLGETEFRRITDACWNADRRLADMAADGVDQQVVLPTPVFFAYERDPLAATEVAAVLNDLALIITQSAPSQLLPFCQVPLQDSDAACRELERCQANGHRGVEIGNHVGDLDLDSAGVETFLQHCALLGMPVFVHPWDMGSSARLDRWMSQWLVGMPMETHLSILALILSGSFDRLPASLRIAFAHGGGSFPFWVGRADNAWHGRPDAVGANSAHPPSHYLDRFSVDSLVFSGPALRLLIEVMGAERILLGSDYPYPLGERPAGHALTLAGCTEAQTRAISETNAQAFLGA